MAQHDLADTYFDRLSEATRRVFELEKQNAALARQGDSSEIFIEAQAKLADAQSADKRSREQISELSNRCTEHEERVSTLERQLRAEKREVAKLRDELKAQPTAADELNVVVEAQDPHSRPKREREEDAQSLPPARKGRTKRVTLTDPEILYRTENVPLDHEAKVEDSGVRHWFRVLMDSATQAEPRTADPQDIAPRMNVLLSGLVQHLEAQKGRKNWHERCCKVFQDGKVRCVRSYILSMGTNWSHDGNGAYACNECMKQGLPCFVRKGDEFWVLPLHPDDRTTAVGDDDVLMERWVRGPVGVSSDAEALVETP